MDDLLHSPKLVQRLLRPLSLLGRTGQVQRKKVGETGKRQNVVVVLDYSIFSNSVLCFALFVKRLCVLTITNIQIIDFFSIGHTNTFRF